MGLAILCGCTFEQLFQDVTIVLNQAAGHVWYREFANNWRELIFCKPGVDLEKRLAQLLLEDYLVESFTKCDSRVALALFAGTEDFPFQTLQLPQEGLLDVLFFV